MFHFSNYNNNQSQDTHQNTILLVRLYSLSGCPEYNTKIYLMVRLKFWCSERLKYYFIAITPRSSLTQSDSNGWGPIYGPNRSV